MTRRDAFLAVEKYYGGRRLRGARYDKTPIQLRGLDPFAHCGRYIDGNELRHLGNGKCGNDIACHRRCSESQRSFIPLPGGLGNLDLTSHRHAANPQDEAGRPYIGAEKRWLRKIKFQKGLSGSTYL